MSARSTSTLRILVMICSICCTTTPSESAARVALHLSVPSPGSASKDLPVL
ncbi:hypothetical protein BC835DRAFT_1398385 [Cytidiella melzeri]|nr:hypothetical protein BC835DRAFT_1398385 [Cytidiella melzeri]